MTEHNGNNSEGEGQYWWVLPLLGFVVIVGLLMAETAMLAVLP